MRVVDERGVSLLVEYLILMAILSVFVFVLGMSVHNVLTETQVSRVVENQFADVASQVSAFYTDYTLLRPQSGYIRTKVSMLPEIGDYKYSVKLKEEGDKVYVVVGSTDNKFLAESGLGLNKFIMPDGGVLPIESKGEVLSTESESENKPEISYEKEEECPFDVKPRMYF